MTKAKHFPIFLLAYILWSWEDPAQGHSKYTEEGKTNIQTDPGPGWARTLGEPLDQPILELILDLFLCDMAYSLIFQTILNTFSPSS